MLFVLKSMFGFDASRLPKKPDQRAAAVSPQPDKPKAKRSRHEEKLLREWIEDDEWRVGKP